MPQYIMTCEGCVSFHVEADNEDQAYERASAIESLDLGTVQQRVSPHIDSLLYVKTYGHGALDLIEEDVD